MWIVYHQHPPSYRPTSTNNPYQSILTAFLGSARCYPNPIHSLQTQPVISSIQSASAHFQRSFNYNKLFSQFHSSRKPSTNPATMPTTRTTRKKSTRAARATSVRLGPRRIPRCPECNRRMKFMDHSRNGDDYFNCPKGCCSEPQESSCPNKQRPGSVSSSNGCCSHSTHSHHMYNF